MVQRAGPGDMSGKDNPICPVCLKEIKAKDRVSGRRDDVMHEACDHVRERSAKPPPNHPKSD